MKKKILLIEDEKDLAELVKIRLEANGYEVDIAYDGKEGILKVISCKPDLVLLDVMLPKKTGMEVLMEIKRSSFNIRKTPVIMLSAVEDTNTLLDAEKFGAEDYVIKSNNPQDLLRLIDKHIL